MISNFVENPTKNDSFPTIFYGLQGLKQKIKNLVPRVVFEN